MHWKIKRDPIYSLIYDDLGLQGLEEAGFFFDSDPDDAPLDDIDWMCTPVDKLKKRLSQNHSGKKLVLLSTGSLSPIHRGHIQIMEEAKIFFETQGANVLGGYLSTGHEEYIDSKLGEAALSTAHRLLLCAKSLQNSDWLMLDPWEAVARKIAVNFTDVFCRLEAYLHHHISPELELVYVCGGDNAGFALSFLQKGSCAVVHRPEYTEKFEKYKQHSLLTNHPAIFFIGGDDEASSTRIRAGEFHFLPENLRESDLSEQTWNEIQLRVEKADVVQDWNNASTKWSSFQETIMEIFQKYTTAKISTHQAPLPSSSLPIISLDSLAAAPIQLSVSRVFELGGYDLIGYAPRPESISLTEQIARIPDGSYQLHDDDQMTGGTLHFIRSILPPRIQINEVSVGQKGAERRAEIVDSRDFLLGARYAGLVLKMPTGLLVRLPYCFPYVDPYARAGISARECLRFSIAIWKANAVFFAELGLQLSDFHPSQQQFFTSLGFTQQTPILDIIHWHLRRLQTFIQSKTHILLTLSDGSFTLVFHF